MDPTVEVYDYREFKIEVHQEYETDPPLYFATILNKRLKFPESAFLSIWGDSSSVEETKRLAEERADVRYVQREKREGSHLQLKLL